MAIVNTKSRKVLRHEPGVLGHEGPEEWVVFRTGSISELDAIAPDNNLAAKICLRVWPCVITHGIGIPDPAIIHQRQGLGIVVIGSVIEWQPCEICLDQRVCFGYRSKFRAVVIESEIFDTIEELVHDSGDISVVFLVEW